MLRARASDSSRLEVEKARAIEESGPLTIPATCRAELPAAGVRDLQSLARLPTEDAVTGSAATISSGSTVSTSSQQRRPRVAAI